MARNAAVRTLEHRPFRVVFLRVQPPRSTGITSYLKARLAYREGLQHWAVTLFCSDVDAAEPSRAAKKSSRGWWTRGGFLGLPAYFCIATPVPTLSHERHRIPLRRTFLSPNCGQ
jgi:hypothetical protein